MAKSANFIALKALLGWDDASTDDIERLVTLNGDLGLTIQDGQVEFFSVDHWSGGVIRTRVSGAWSLGTIDVLAQHLVMVHALTSRG